MFNFIRIQLENFSTCILRPRQPTEELVYMLKQRAKESFAELYDKYCPALCGIICKIINDATAAEDVLQEAFVKIWKNIDNYTEEKGSLFTWVLSIASHTAIDYMRSKQHIYRSQIQNTEINEYIESIPPCLLKQGFPAIIILLRKWNPNTGRCLMWCIFWLYRKKCRKF
ncbi:hypothetical protein BH10BAC2_BH10BAC2_03090 [soil metagenome]